MAQGAGRDEALNPELQARHTAGWAGRKARKIRRQIAVALRRGAAAMRRNQWGNRVMQLAVLTIKKTITLFALVGPVTMIPIFLAAVDGFDLGRKKRFARSLGVSVTIALLIAAFLGASLLDLLGVSLGAMQIGGGIIVLLLAIAMVMGKETSFKGASPPPDGDAGHEASIVPLAVPLLAGPAAFSYVMGNSAWKHEWELVHIVAPILVVGATCWITFHMAATAQRRIRQSALDVVEKIGGFILSAIAIEMIATGLRGLFPVLA